MIATKLFGPVRFVTAAARYLEQRGPPEASKDLLSHNCLRSQLGTRLYDGWEFEHKGKEFSVQVKGSLIFNDSLADDASRRRRLGCHLHGGETPFARK